MVKAMAMSMPERDFHIGRGLLHGILSAVVFVALDVAFFGTGTFSGNSAQGLGGAMGKMAGWALVLAFVASYAFQTRRRALGGSVLFLLTALFVLQLFVLTRRVHTIHALENAASPLAVAERSRPAPAGSSGRFCQPALAFSFPAPGGNMVPDMALEQTVKQSDPYATLWIWRDPVSNARLAILAGKGVENKESSFRSFIAGFKGSLSANAASRLGPETVRWRDDGGELALSGTVGASTRLEMRCLSRGLEGEAPPVVVCAQTMSPGTDTLRQVRTGLSLAPCGSGTR
ncbi:MAG TPA: hypothetical protein VHC97_19970 [Thermoanaerobaculia bacterium]|jgi:hypothetical protein|nr:hypothetical protein [Thermoanaerobaculia bacterium]